MPGPLRVVSLGNARDEKGLLELFDAARILDLRGDADDLQIVLQANDPNAQIVQIVERFAADPPSNVRLIRDALSTDDYNALLASADIVATPYWRSIYEARTSGVFLEAVAAGKPVICTADTWMSDELGRAGAGLIVPDGDPVALAIALVEARDRFTELAAKAEADRPKWRAFHNGERLVELLVHGASPAEVKPERRAAVLFPWGDPLLTPSSGAAHRVRPVIDLLATRFDKVRVLQDAHRETVELDGVSFEADPLLERSERRLWFKLVRLMLKALGARDGEELYALLHLAPKRDTAYRARVEEIVGWADLILLEYPFWADVVRDACDRQGKSFVLTAHDVISDQCRSSSPLRSLTRTLERKALACAPRRLAISRDDAQTFGGWGLPTEWSPTGLDLQTLRTDIPGGRDLLNALCGWPVEDRTPLLLFIGSKFRPNAIAAEAIAEMAEHFDQAHLDRSARFVVAGACHAPLRTERFAALGFVDGLTAHLLRQECALMLAPLTLGTGVSLKSYEALACGAALISTTIGIRGLDGLTAEAVVVEDDLSRWPDRLATLLANPAWLSELRHGASAYSAGMDYHRTYALYLEAGGMGEATPIRHDLTAGRRRELWLEAAAAADRLGLAPTADACIAAVLTEAPDDRVALTLAARRSVRDTAGDHEAPSTTFEAALRRGADPIALLRDRAETLVVEGQTTAAESLLAQAAGLSAPRRLVRGEEQAVRADAWAAYHGDDKAWALAIAQEVVAAWPQVSRPPDYDYLCAAILSERLGFDPAVVEPYARRALDGGFDPFWCAMILTRVRAAQGVEDGEWLQTARGAVLAAGGDTARRDEAVSLMSDLAWRRFEAGEMGRAQAVVEQILALAPDTGSALYLAGELNQARSGSPKEAVELFQHAERAGFDPGWCRAHLAQSYSRLGDAEAAVDAALDALSAPGQQHRPSATDTLCSSLWNLYEASSPSLSPLVRRVAAAGVTDGRVAYLLGEVQTRSAEFSAAADAYSLAHAAGFDPYWALRRRAEAFALLGLEDFPDRLAAAAVAGDEEARQEVLAPLLSSERMDLDADRIEAVRGAGGGAAALDRLALTARAALQQRSMRQTSPPEGEELVAVDPDAEAFDPAPEGLSASAAQPFVPQPKLGREVDRLWRVFERRDYEKTLRLALGLLRSGRVRPPQSAHGHYLVAECLQILLRDLPEAERRYGLALNDGFDPYWVHFNRAQLRLKLQDQGGAAADLRAALAAADTASDPGRSQAALDSLSQLEGDLAQA